MIMFFKTWISTATLSNDISNAQRAKKSVGGRFLSRDDGKAPQRSGVLLTVLERLTCSGIFNDMFLEHNVSNVSAEISLLNVSMTLGEGSPEQEGAAPRSSKLRLLEAIARRLAVALLPVQVPESVPALDSFTTWAIEVSWSTFSSRVSEHLH